MVKNIKNGYRIPILEGLECVHNRNFNQDAPSSTHNSHMYRIYINEISKYNKHKDTIKTLFLDSVEMMTKKRDKIFTMRIRDGETSLFKGKDINDVEESKKKYVDVICLQNIITIHTLKT